MVSALTVDQYSLPSPQGRGYVATHSLKHLSEVVVTCVIIPNRDMDVLDTVISECRFMIRHDTDDMLDVVVHDEVPVIGRLPITKPQVGDNLVNVVLGYFARGHYILYY
jgi:hypothetical protein